MFSLPPLSPEQHALVEEVRALSRERFAPRAARYDAESILPAENYQDLRARGLLGLTIPKEYGGLGAEILGAPAQLLTIDLSGFALGYAATYLGIGEAAFDFIVDYAKAKTFKPSNEPLSHHPLTQRSIAEMGTAIRAARLLLFDAARAKVEEDKDATMLAANQAKYLCT